MPDWSSPAELLRDADVFLKFIHSCLGLYAWEWFISLDFDWAFVTGKKGFRWPMIFYFLNRYILLFALVGIVIGMDSVSELNCQALYTFNQLAGNMAMGFASINLSIRTIAVYANSKYIIGALVLLILGHWSLILQGVVISAEWNPQAAACAITNTNTKILSATFIYTMAFDLTVLVLNVYKLTIARRVDGAMGASRLGKLIFADGLIYFMIAFVSNLVATVFMILNLNSIMNVIFNVPAVIASSIAACRVVRRLSTFASSGPEVFSSSMSGPNHQFRNVNASGVVSRSKPPHGGVHVQMETFTRDDISNTPFYVGERSLEEAKQKHSERESDIDLESQKAAAL